MRFLSAFWLCCLFLGVYYFYLKRMPATEMYGCHAGISLTGVKMDLLQIADAEHG